MIWLPTITYRSIVMGKLETLMKAMATVTGLIEDMESEGLNVDKLNQAYNDLEIQTLSMQLDNLSIEDRITYILQSGYLFWDRIQLEDMSAEEIDDIFKTVRMYNK